MNTEAINTVEINGGPAVPLVVPALPPTRLPRAIVWLLDVDLGGAPLRFATADIVVPSREDGGAGRLYQRGLDPLDVALGSDSLTVTLPLPDAAELHTVVRQWRGRAFVLRAYREEPALEDATVVLQGVVVAASWLDPSVPDSVSLGLRRGTEALSSTVLAASERVDGDTWLQDVVRTAPPALGQSYPVVIGYPGREDVEGGDTYPAAPAWQVDSTSGARILLIARGKTEAGLAGGKVWLHDLSEDGGSPEFRVTYVSTDDIDQPCTLMTLVGASKDPPDDSKLYTAWSPATGYGGGELFEGAPITGLGTLLLWGARNYSRAVVDVGAMRSVRAELDRYQIDAVINDPGVLWDEWVDANLLEVYGLERVDGPRGVWYREARFAADPARVRATLTTSAAAPGWQVTRASAYSESGDDTCSEVTVLYALSGNGPTPQRRVTLASALREDDPSRTRVSPICRRAAEVLGGRVERSWTVATTAHTGTAWRIARRLVERYALPAVYVDLQGGPDLADLRPYDTVEVDDADAPGPVLGVVQPQIRLSETSVVVTVRIQGR